MWESVFVRKASPPLRISVFSVYLTINCSFCVLPRGLLSNGGWRGEAIGLMQPFLVPVSLVVVPFSNGFRGRTLCPSERIQQIVRLFEQRRSYPSSVWIMSEHWNSVGVFHSLHSFPPSKTNIWRLLCCLSVFYHFKTLSSYGWSKL